MLALIVPAIGAVAMWLATGSPFALWFAALGPVTALAALLDARRADRRERRRDDWEEGRARARLHEDVARAHADERADLWARHPDLAGMVLRPEEIWRAVPGRAGILVAGRGQVDSAVRVRGDDLLTATARAAAAQLADAPVLVPAVGGIAVIGPPPLADAVARGLVLQLLCQFPPGALQLGTGSPDWAADAPHHAPGVRRLVCAPPVAAGELAVIALPPGVPPPPECAAVLTVDGLDAARLDHDGRVREVTVEAVSAAQGRAVSRLLVARTASLVGARLPDRVDVGDLPAPPAGRGLAAAVGAAVDGPYLLDLVSDGPHAVVAGVTGAGKSELLTTWVTGMAAGRSPDEVTFLLADFKGGTAFDRLAGLPHVVGVVTDLDDHGARRAIESLRAEIRHRETVLAANGVRDIGDPGAGLPRLVIVVDEFAALLQLAPDLAAVFTDVAARGRALGMHLVLGTQRAHGVVRDALLANCPLRVSLRVTDTADSRFLLGGDEAAAETERGVAHIRVADAVRATRVRIARTGPADIAAAARPHAALRVRAPWLPPLPTRLSPGDLPATADGLVLGLADEPARQRQEPLLLGPEDGGLAVIGAPGSGRSGLLHALVAQDPRAAVIPADPEAAWDVLEPGALADAPGGLLVCDDVDLLLSRFPPDAAAAVLERLTLLVRTAGRRPVVSALRVGGPAARVVELCARRAVLRMPTRLDHLAAGADPAGHDPHAPRGRGSVDGIAVQFLEAPAPPLPPPRSPEPWWPVPGVSGVVLNGRAAAGDVRAALIAQGASVAAPGEPDAQGGPVRVFVGDVEQWQRAWQMLTTVRARGELLVDAACAADYRVLCGDRTPPPYCAPGRGRAWLVGAGPTRRVLLPGVRTGGAAERQRG